jgi:hypothetical protein
MVDEPAIREKARDAIRSGKIPSRAQRRTFGRPGSGDICSICAEPLRRDQLELEIDFQRPGAAPEVHHLHPRCLAAWGLERTKLTEDSEGHRSI